MKNISTTPLEHQEVWRFLGDKLGKEAGVLGDILSRISSFCGLKHQPVKRRITAYHVGVRTKSWTFFIRGYEPSSIPWAQSTEEDSNS